MTLIRTTIQPEKREDNKLYLVTGHMEGEEGLHSVLVFGANELAAKHNFGQCMFDHSGKQPGQYGMCIHAADEVGEVAGSARSKFPWAHLWAGLATTLVIHMLINGGW